MVLAARRQAQHVVDLGGVLDRVRGGTTID
jgi:hypothetical protein